MPAAAVIPALIAYIKVVAVKKLVVEPWVSATGLLRFALACIGFAILLSEGCVCCVRGAHDYLAVYLEEIGVFKASDCV